MDAPSSRGHTETYADSLLYAVAELEQTRLRAVAMNTQAAARQCGQALAP
jgi:hypothetical protein